MIVKRAAFLCISILFLYTAPASSQETLHLGVISGLTGAAAKWNTFQNMGMQLAAEELLAQGSKVSLTFEDSRTRGSHAISAYNRLVSLAKVDALIANDFGLAISPLLPILKKSGDKLLVSLVLADDRYCSAGGERFASIASRILETRSAFLRFFELHPNVKRLGLVVFDDPDWGNNYRSVWEDLARERGIEIVETYSSNDWSPDFRLVVAKMMSKKADAIFVAHEPHNFMKAVREANFLGAIVTANNVLELLADSDTPPQELVGVYTVTQTIAPEFAAAFRARFKREPILDAFLGYEVVRSLAKAATINRAELHKGLREVRYQGVAGAIDFSKSSCLGNYGSWGLYRFNSTALGDGPT